MRSPSYKFLETSTFYHIFISFLFQTNTDLLLIHQNSNDFTQETLYLSFISKKNGIFHRKVFSKHPLFTTFSLFLTVSEVCNISNKYWLHSKSTKNCFYTNTLHPPSFQKRIYDIHPRSFHKHQMFTTFLLVFTVDEMCNISNKYQPPSNLAKYKYFCKRDVISLLHFEKKIGVLHRKRFSKHSLLSTFSIFLIVSEVCNISKKY